MRATAEINLDRPFLALGLIAASLIWTIVTGGHAQSTRPALPTPATTSSASQPTKPPCPALAAATTVERQTLDVLLRDVAWPRRAVAAMRLERFACDESRAMLAGLLRDPAWQVRAFAIRSLARRGVPPDPAWLADEQEPRVLRTALRHHYPVALDRLERGVRFLLRSTDLEQKMLGAEIGAASGNPELIDQARETTRQIIMKMGRIEAGSLSPRLAALTGKPDLRRHFLWQSWLRKVGRRFEIQPAYALDAEAPPPPLSAIAALETDRFAALEDYMETLTDRQVDLAICLDCTASMSGELAEAQGGIDDLMLFAADVVGGLRVSMVGYRDRRDEFETRGWDFTSDIDTARRQLWQLTAEGGGDEPEAVYPALKLACTQFTWKPENVKVLVLVGDAPPHVGYGAQCVQIAAGARAQAGLTTHAIQVEGEEVKHFAEIAKAGGGRCISLDDRSSLIAEITGLTLADRFQDEFREFFAVYLELCR